MALYYYARKLQKADRKEKALPSTSLTMGSDSGCSSANASANASSSSASAGSACSSSSSGSGAVGVGGAMGPTRAQAAVASAYTADATALVSRFQALQLQKPIVNTECDYSPSPGPSSSYDGGTSPPPGCESLQILIQHLIPTESHYPDRAFIFAFLLSSRLYLRPHELLGHVFRATIPAPTNSSQYVNHGPSICVGGAGLVDASALLLLAAGLDKKVPNMVKLMGDWTELFPYDFRDEQMMAHVRQITERCVGENPVMQQEVEELLTSLLARLTSLEKYEDLVKKINNAAESADPKTSPLIMSICPIPLTLAQQLTHVELDRLCYISSEEFVHAYLEDRGGPESNYKELKKTYNLDFYIQWFNHLGLLVSSEICKTSKKKSRVRLVEFWIDVAHECLRIGNFNSVMAILNGLNAAPVSRLRKTWSKVTRSALNIIEHQMDPAGNYAAYRTLLQALSVRGPIPDEQRRILVPYFPLLLKDLFSTCQGCASKLPNGYLNVENFWKFAKEMSQVIAWQQIKCSFPKVPDVVALLQTLPVFTQDGLCDASYECEPPENGQDLKERFKYLREEAASNSETAGSSSDASARMSSLQK